MRRENGAKAMSEFENEGTVSSEVSNESADQSGVEQQGQESQDNEGQSSQEQTQEQSPSLTRRELEELLAGVSGHFSGQLGQLKREIAQQLRQLSQQRQSSQKPVIPDSAKDFELKTQEDLYNVLKGLKDSHDSKVRALENKFAMADRASKEAQQSEQLYGYLESQTNSAVEKLPIFKDPKANEVLRRHIVAEFYTNNGDLRKMNIMKTASDLAALISARSNGRARITNPNPAVSRTQGSPSRPEQQRKEPKSYEDFAAQHEEILKKLAEEMGVEE